MAETAPDATVSKSFPRPRLISGCVALVASEKVVTIPGTAITANSIMGCSFRSAIVQATTVGVRAASNGNSTEIVLTAFKASGAKNDAAETAYVNWWVLR